MMSGDYPRLIGWANGERRTANVEENGEVLYGSWAVVLALLCLAPPPWAAARAHARVPFCSRRDP